MLTSTRRVLGMLAGAVIVTATLSLSSPASAGPPGSAPPGCTWQSVGNDEYILDCSTGGSDGDDGGPGGNGGGGEPSCDLTYGRYTEFCEGTAACWGNNPAEVQDPQELKGVEKPSPDSHVAYKDCRRPDGSTYDEWYWTEDADGPTPAELAERALAMLKLPVFTPTFNPPVTTLVNLETWWWAEGAPQGDITSPSALGVVAIATPARMEVDPGDGSGVMTCDLATTRSDECSHVYRKGSYKAAGRTADGKAAFAARMRIVYDLRFELDGTALELPDIQTSISTDWQQQAIPVREAQSLVVPGSR